MITETKTDTSHYDRCRTMMMKHQQHHLQRTVVVAVLMLINAYVSIIQAPIIYGLFALYGFFFGAGIFLYCTVTVVMGFLAIPERPKLLAVTCILIVIGIIGKWITLYLGIPMLVLFLWQIPEAKQALWIKKQTGYPHFNERFDEQMSHFRKEYQPMHQLDNLRDAEMPDMPETASPDFVLPEEMPSVPELSAPDLTVSDLTETEPTAPDISKNISETVQMQENDLRTDRILMKPKERN